MNWAKTENNGSFLVVIDAGHGGHDTGTSGTLSQEKHIALSIALEVGRLLNGIDSTIDILYTRESDVFVPLHKRVAIANEANADLFVSIHCNAADVVQATGVETYVMGLHSSKENLEVAKRENSAILYEENYAETYNNFDPFSIEGHILLSAIQNNFLGQSIEAADRIQKQFTRRTNLMDRGVRQAGFLLLRQTTMPSILIETAFLSNPKDEEILLSQEGRLEVSRAIAEGINQYASLARKAREREPVIATLEKSEIIHSELTSTLEPLSIDVPYGDDGEEYMSFRPDEKILNTQESFSNQEETEQLPIARISKTDETVQLSKILDPIEEVPQTKMTEIEIVLYHEEPEAVPIEFVMAMADSKDNDIEKNISLIDHELFGTDSNDEKAEYREDIGTNLRSQVSNSNDLVELNSGHSGEEEKTSVQEMIRIKTSESPSDKADSPGDKNEIKPVIATKSVKSEEIQPANRDAEQLSLESLTVVYRIQIASTRNKVSPITFQEKLEEYVVDMKAEQDIYKYIVGEFDNLVEAVEVRNIIEDKGFRGAFVVAYRGASRVQLSEITP